jgi:mRNA-degrading endonuclease toxin of MazEF toxin-antitoxin module
MPVVNRGGIWRVDFGMAAKVRPALLLTGAPTDDELDLLTVLLHITGLRGNRWELNLPKPFLKPGAFHLQQIQTISTSCPAIARRASAEARGASHLPQLSIGPPSSRDA